MSCSFSLRFQSIPLIVYGISILCANGIPIEFD